MPSGPGACSPGEVAVDCVAVVVDDDVGGEAELVALLLLLDEPPQPASAAAPASKVRMRTRRLAISSDER
jgi:hypothetical protein